jgi:mono/diheme cytochrome c family protein
VIKKILVSLLGLIAFILILLLVVVNIRYTRTFEAPYPQIVASSDSAIIARGRYLAYGPAHCSYCHAPTSEIERIEAGQEVALSGGFNFYLPIGTIYAPNITPDVETGIGKLRDDEIARSLRYGVRHDGRALIDFMPFYDMSNDDMVAIISFLRAQEPVRNPRPEHEWNLLGKAVMSFAIEPMGDGEVPEAPAADSSALYGQYLATNVANCRGCHTNRDMMTGAFIGEELAGSGRFEVIDMATGKIIDGKHIVTPNITPDPETGRMRGWKKSDFITRMRAGRVIAGSPMPWGPFSRMNDMELTALWNYLKTVKPVKNVTPVGIQEGNP